MGIGVLKPGFFTTIQDLGRYGYQRLGVSPAGSMDPLALRLANILVGNPTTSAALEMTLLGPQLEFQQEALIAICGANLCPVCNNELLPLWRPISIPRGSVISFSGSTIGCRSYLAVAGGFKVPEILGSKSTYVKGRFGGVDGRPLRTGDCLDLESFPEHLVFESSHDPLNKMRASSYPLWFSKPSWLPGYLCEGQSETIVRVIPGPEFDCFQSESIELFLKNTYSVTPQSDRMGYRLSGSPVQLSVPQELVSDAIVNGTIQIPPNGQPILLMADRQTTGGYPRIGVVASIDLPLVAQLKPGEQVRFKKISVQDAQLLLQNQENQLSVLQKAIQLKFMSRQIKKEIVT